MEVLTRTSGVGAGGRNAWKLRRDLNLKLDALAPRHIFMTSAFFAVTHHDSFYGAAATMRRILANEPSNRRIIPSLVFVVQTYILTEGFPCELVDLAPCWCSVVLYLGASLGRSAEVVHTILLPAIGSKPQARRCQFDLAFNAGRIL